MNNNDNPINEADNEDVNIPKNKRAYDKTLNEKQKRFVREYLIDFNASRAYRAAGYGVQGKLKNAKASAYQLLNSDRIQAFIRHEMDERARRVHVDQDKVIRELAKIAFSNPKRVMEWDSTGVTVKASRDISDDDAASISEVSVTYNNYGANVSVKHHSKTKALELLGQHLGMFDKEKTPQGDVTEEARKFVDLIAEMEANLNPEPEDK